MWDWIFESFAECMGVTRKPRPGVMLLFGLLTLSVLTVAFIETGTRGVLALGLVLALAVLSSIQVLRARAALFRAARAPLTDPKQRPALSGLDLPPTARSLYQLANAVDRARRGETIEASTTLDRVDRDRLRPPEIRLFFAARALVSLSLADGRRAAHDAARALPTGCDDLDFQLGRALVADAWSDAERLMRIDESWASEGVAPGVKDALPRLRAIMRLRIDPTVLDGVASWDAKALADEARAVGDEALAADLEAKSHPSVYR